VFNLQGKESNVKQLLAAAAALVTLAAGAPASAQQPGQPQDGARTDSASLTALAQAVAGSPEARRPLAKLRSPLCLAVAANDEAFARTVATRIIENAKAAGVPTGRDGCEANALVTFSDDPRGQIEAFGADGAKLIKRLSKAEIAAALDARDPAYVFQPVEATPRFGEGDGVFIENDLSVGGMAWSKERSFLRTPQDILTTLVMIDAGAIAGLSAAQLADYATLRLLAPTGEITADSEAASQTILSLFSAPLTAPHELTRTDRAYLQSLYNLPRTAFASEVLQKTVEIAAK
jgi:hypothetical protein